MRNSSSFGLRRVLLVAVVGLFMLTLMVSGVSAVSGTFDPVSPGSASDPGPTYNAAPDPLEIEWELPTTDVVGTLAYTFQISFNGGAFQDVPVPPGEITEAGGVVTWAPTGATAIAINNLLVEGDFEWKVLATDTDDSTATSTSFFFQVDLLAPGDFELDGPAGASVATGVYLRDLSAPVDFTWTPALTADEYQFVMFQISNNTRIGEVINIENLDPVTDLACAEVCTLSADLDAEGLTTGQYAWTVLASNEEGETEASNAPYYFQVNVDPIELVRNGGFEAPAGSPNNPIPAQWKIVNGNGERRDCRANKLPDGYNGACAYLGTGGPVAVMNQKVTAKLLKQLKIGAGDVITVNALVQSTNAVPAATKIVVSLSFGGTKTQNINVALANTPGATFTAITTVPTDVQDKGTVKQITVKVITKSKVYIDDVSVVLNPVAPAPPLLTLPN